MRTVAIGGGRYIKQQMRAKITAPSSNDKTTIASPGRVTVTRTVGGAVRKPAPTLGNVRRTANGFISSNRVNTLQKQHPAVQRQKTFVTTTNVRKTPLSTQ